MNDKINFSGVDMAAGPSSSCIVTTTGSTAGGYVYYPSTTAPSWSPIDPNGNTGGWWTYPYQYPTNPDGSLTVTPVINPIHMAEDEEPPKKEITVIPEDIMNCKRAIHLEDE